MKLVTGDWATLARHAQPIRRAVFIEEQGVPVELEWDGIDPQCVHAVAFDSAAYAVATGRLLPDGHIGRMAVLQPRRGRGYGTAVLNALIAIAQGRGDHEVVLSAQTHARGFYERLGFHAYGEPYLDAGILHVDMSRRLGARP